MDTHEWFDKNIAQAMADAPRSDETNFEHFQRVIRDALRKTDSEDFKRILLKMAVDNDEGICETHLLMENAFTLLHYWDDAELLGLEYLYEGARIKVDYENSTEEE